MVRQDRNFSKTSDPFQLYINIMAGQKITLLIREEDPSNYVKEIY